MYTKNIIISQPWGGLGDNLQFSTLPELFTNKGYNVYISNNNKVRNNEIFELVWKKNPYIKGVMDNKNGIVVGSSMQNRWPPAKQNYYSMHRVEIAHGFEPTNYYPKIYYEAKNINEYKDTVIIDLTGSSQVYEFKKYKEYIDYFCNRIDLKKKIYIISFKNIIISPIFTEVYKYLKTKINGTLELNISSLFEYCDILKSCDTLIIVNSGINSLASAIKTDSPKPYVLCYNPWSHFSPEEIKGCYNYKNVEYFQSKIN